MTILGNLRRRITLMREEKTQGAGGRLVKTTPVIADVWATVEESAGSAEERADKQVFSSNARFQVRFSKLYMMARFIEWRGMKYRITGTEVSRTDTPTLSFSTRLMEEGTL